MYKLRFFSKIILLCTIFFCFHNNIYSQVENELAPKKNCFKLNPQAFVAATFMISYERCLSQNVTFQLSAGITAKSEDNPLTSSGYYNSFGNYVPGTTTTSKDVASGGLVEGMFKYYFLKGKSEMSGLYAGPYGGYSKNNFEINTMTTTGNIASTTVDYSIQSYSGGAVFGFQCVIKNAFVMDMFAGGGVKISDNSAPAWYLAQNSYNSDYPFPLLQGQDYTGITPKIGFRLGFVF